MQLLSNNKVTNIGFEKAVFNKDSLIISNHNSLEDINFINAVLPSNVIFAIYDNEKNSTLKLGKKRELFFYNPLNPQSLVGLKQLIEGEKPIFIFPEVVASAHKIVSRIHNEISDIIRKTNPVIHPISIAGGESSNFSIFNDIKVELFDPFTIDYSHIDSKDTSINFISNFLVKKMQSNFFKQFEKKDINLYNELLLVSKKYSDKKVIIEDTTSSMTYKDLLLSINVFYQKLKPLLSTQKNIGVLLPSSNATVLTVFSLFKLGKVPAMLNFSMGLGTLLDCLDVGGIKTVITSKSFVEQGGLQNIIEAFSYKVRIIYLEDLKESIHPNEKILGFTQYALNAKADEGFNEVILFTSGSENKPKGVILTHDNLYSNIYQSLSIVKILPDSDRMFNALPMFHSFGFTIGSILPVIIGLPVFLYPSPLHHKIIPELIYQKQSTIMFGTSTFFSMYGKDAHPNTLQTLKIAVVGGEKLKDDVYETWFEKFGVKIVEGYGVTEASPVLAINTPLANKRHSIGKLLPCVEYKLEEVEGIEGYNLLVKGPNIMKGYLIHGKGFIPHSDWYKTGDVVKIDEDGFLQIISRLKRFCKVGGEMVSLNLIEELCFKTYGEHKFAAVSIPDKRKGEKVILFSSLEDANIKEIKKTIKNEKLSALLTPKEIVYIPSIPLLGSGKTDYVSLQSQAIELFEK